MKEIIIEVLTSNKAKTFYWQTGVGFIGLIIIVVQGIQPDIVQPALVLGASALLAGLNMLSKYINKDVLPKL